MKKEICLLLKQPVFYIAAAVTTASCALYFFVVGQFFVYGAGSSDLRFFFVTIPYISILVIPVLTMGQWEQNSLFFDQTLPISDGQLVFSKWFSSFLLSLLLLFPGVSIPITVSFFGNIDIAQFITGYGGIFCFMAASCALGVFFSALCGGKVASFLVTSLVLAVCCLCHLVPLYVNLPTWLSSLCRGLSFAWHFDAAGKGILDTRDIGFYGIITVTSLVLTTEFLRIKKRGCL